MREREAEGVREGGDSVQGTTQKVLFEISPRAPPRGVLEISSVPVYFVHGPFNSQMHRRFSASDIFVPFRVPIAWLPVPVLVFWPVSSRSPSCIY